MFYFYWYNPFLSIKSITESGVKNRTELPDLSEFRMKVEEISISGVSVRLTEG